MHQVRRVATSKGVWLHQYPIAKASVELRESATLIALARA